MEYNLPSNKSGGTLWETEEQALRFLMEDGKLSISLRNMIRFKTHQMNLRYNNIACFLLLHTLPILVVFVYKIHLQTRVYTSKHSCMYLYIHKHKLTRNTHTYTHIEMKAKMQKRIRKRLRSLVNLKRV